MWRASWGGLMMVEWCRSGCDTSVNAVVTHMCLKRSLRLHAPARLPGLSEPIGSPADALCYRDAAPVTRCYMRGCSDEHTHDGPRCAT
ncbi:uncharacterized protein LY79DRAFT_100584 [Colletotrichum navitas]|uniref:Uncharacterized protein n=1 Tax=Colletotrichum navitas TaxID=681940 RepID=A0AAD8Q4K7_9PEZI|nr:uncharacterized protein LY79DRAFT_100584 [Colletotrichum navitas]KAK1595510.1 hypothetical protein LY79DRAFT_100584 [Colletotrichum navitas]